MEIRPLTNSHLIFNFFFIAFDAVERTLLLTVYMNKHDTSEGGRILGFYAV